MIWAGAKGWFLGATALAACPCFWPAWIALAGGTATGAFLLDNPLLAGAAASAWFVIGGGLALRALRPADPPHDPGP